MKKLIWISSVLFATACGDDGSPANPDAPPDIDAPPIDGPPIDTPTPWTQPMAHSFQLSGTLPDVIMAATAGPAGSFYAAGWLDTDVDPDPLVTTIERRIIVFKLGASGIPDATFGTGGKKDTGFVFRGGNDDIDIATLSDGSIIVSATVAAAAVNGVDANDTDIGLIKLAASNGAVVDGWGTNGLLRHSFNTSLASGNRDVSRGLAIGAGDTIYVSGAGRGPGNIQPADVLPRTDLDWYVAKFTSTTTGALDTTWSTDGADGQINVDLFLPTAADPTGPAVHAAATARSLIVLADGSVISGGYVNNTLTPSPQTVMFKLGPTGELAPGFAENGIFHSTVFGGQTEVYNFALHTDKIVTGGYGRDQADGPNDWVSMRFNVSDGMRDMTWGAVAQGKNLINVNPTSTTDGSNCRNAIALPNGKTLLIGSAGPSPAQGLPPLPETDAYFAVLDTDGTLDTSYGTGIAKYAFSSTADGADQFWGAAVNGNKVLIVGWRAATVSPQTAGNNDNSYAVLLDLE